MKYTIRLIENDDAAFILELRNNERLNRYLNVTSAKIEDQLNWIREYKIRESEKKEFYFIIIENGIKRGLYRLYKINSVSFTIGSWLFNKCENKNLPILSDLVISDFGFSNLKNPILLFDVRKDNRRVIQYHSLKMPLCYNEDELNNYYLIQSTNWEKAKASVLSFLDIKNDDYEELKKSFQF